MPQFDQGSFLNQVFWFFVIFINSYFFITYFFLPLISKNLKFRKKKIFINNNNLSEINIEKYNQYSYYNNIFQNISFFFNNSLKDLNTNLLEQKKPIKNKLYSNLNFHKSIINFYSNLTFYPKKFN